MVAEHEGKIVRIANAKLRKGRRDHVVELGISLGKGYRGKKIGTELMLNLIKSIKNLRPKPKIMRLSVFETNKVAIKFYKKLGFKGVARVPDQVQRKKELVDEIVMLKYL